ncbi:MAG: kynureninase [Bradymonadaceae bacterium]
MSIPTTEEYARRRDAEDPLRAYRDEFHVPTDAAGDPLVYLCGNSLGLQPKTARQTVDREMDDWAERAVRGHFEGDRPWYEFEGELAEPMANVVGAKPSEVTLMNTLTVNLHLMLVSFYRPTPKRHKILVEGSAFPSDRYAAVSQIEQRGFDPAESLVEVEPAEGHRRLESGELERAIREHGDELALVLVGGVHYYSGRAFDLDAIVGAAREVGSLVGFDLAHAVGNIELELHEWEPDFAVWCTYKYLNGGPGSVAGCFVHDRHAHSDDLPRFTGWWGNDPDTRFEMADTFEPRPGAAGWKLSNPPILSLAPLEASLSLFDQAGMPAIREKSVELTEYLLALIDELDGDAPEVITPRTPDDRGAQVSLHFGPAAEQLHGLLDDHGVVCDFRPPGVIRVAPAPLYNSFGDVWRFARRLDHALDALE